MNNNNKELDNISSCIDCQNASLRLGQSIHKELGQVFFTISPDPEINDYGNKLPDTQKRSIDFRFKNCMIRLQKYIKYYNYSYHYELNKSMNLHIHGFITIDNTYINYDRNIALMSKIFHKDFGRQYGKCMVSSKFEWIKDSETIYKYVNKSNIYPAKHYDYKEQDITNFLIKPNKEIEHDDTEGEATP